jgi:hypothetical protein
MPLVQQDVDYMCDDPVLPILHATATQRSVRGGVSSLP